MEIFASDFLRFLLDDPVPYSVSIIRLLDMHLLGT